MERVRALLTGRPGSAREALDAIAADVERFRGTAPQIDDTTLVAARCVGVSVTGGRGAFLEGGAPAG